MLLWCRDKPSRRGDLMGKAVRSYNEARKKAHKKHGPCKIHLQVCIFQPGWPIHACSSHAHSSESTRRGPIGCCLRMVKQLSSAGSH